MDSFLKCVQKGFASYMIGYFQSLVADTPAMVEFCARDADKAIVWVPGRMVDAANEMLEAYRKNNGSGTPQPKSLLPVILIATEKDYKPSPPDWASRRQGDPVQVQVPGDPKNRVLDLRSVQRDLRAQIAIFSPEVETASSLATQWDLWMGAIANKRFQVYFELAGQSMPWPVQIESPDMTGVDVPPDLQKNLTIVVFDLNLRPTVPIIKGPPAGQENDGQGDGTYGNPSGYPVVVEADVVPTGRSDLTVSAADDVMLVVTADDIVSQLPVPGAPGALAAAAGDGQVTLSWTAAGLATSYDVFQGAAPGGEGGTPILTGITGTGVVVSGLVNGTPVYFTVKALNGAGTSPASNEASATPAAP